MATVRRYSTAILVGIALPLVTASVAAAIGFIESPTATCRWLKGNTCAITFNYLSVSASPNYMLWMRLRLGKPSQPQRLILHANGFFQTSMYVSPDQIGAIEVPCGKPGTSPDPKPSPNPALPYGESYSYTVDARDSAGLTAANYGTVLCPSK